LQPLSIGILEVMEICKRLKNLLAGEESLGDFIFLHVAFMYRLQLK
jgi:hypothetical protein